MYVLMPVNNDNHIRNHLETSAAREDLDLFIAKAQVSLVPVDEEQADLARRAFRKYGKRGLTLPIRGQVAEG